MNINKTFNLRPVSTGMSYKSLRLQQFSNDAVRTLIQYLILPILFSNFKVIKSNDLIDTKK